MMIKDAYDYPHVFNQAVRSLRAACLTVVALGLIGTAFELVLAS